MSQGDRIRHGETVYAITDSETDALSGRVTFFDNEGEIPHETVRVDLRNFTFELPSRDSGTVHLSPYRRYFGYGPVPSPELLDRLACLGHSMRFNGVADEVGIIPAGYTYIGQFVFHDMTFLFKGRSVTKPNNFRSAVLDLDSVFGPGTSMPHACPAPMALGETTFSELRDLPRATDGAPAIADQRNDSNLALAQVHALVIAFYCGVRRLCNSSGEAKRLARLHFQSAVLHDYARRVVSPEIYEDVRNYGRAILHTDGGAFLLPLEFAGACARFGHSMVRNRYDWNNAQPGADVRAFWGNTFFSAETPISQLPGDWIADWKRLLAMGGQAETHQFAARIDTTLAWPLKVIPDAALPDLVEQPSLSNNLAIRSLHRGAVLRLNSAQEICRRIDGILHKTGRVRFSPLTDDELLQGEPVKVRAALTSGKIGERLLDATPLWFYVLKEARVRSDGLCLGPLGSRIIMETIHAAIEASDTSILYGKSGQRWLPDKRLGASTEEEYSFADMVTFVGS